MYNKILDLDWFSAHVFDIQLTCRHVGIQLELFVIGYWHLDTWSICMSILHALMDSISMFPIAFGTYEIVPSVFALKKSSQDIFISKICHSFY